MNMKMAKGLLMIALITGSIAIPSGVALAADLNEYTLDAMVVTATRTEKKILDVPASVQVITAMDIENSGAVYVDDVFKKVPGVNVSRTSGLANSKPVVTMRGVKSGSDVLVLVDGQPMVNAYSGVVNWNDIPVNSIEKIEVVKGPGSAIYGSNAMAGVINITTKKAQKLHGSASVSYGTNHTWIKNINFGDKVGKFGYDLYYQGTDSHTYSDMATASISKDKDNKAEAGSGYDVVSKTTGGQQVIIGKKGEKIWDEDNYKARFTYDFDENKTLSLGFMKTENEYSYDYDSHENWVGKLGSISLGNGNKFNVSKSAFDDAPGGVEEKIYTIGYTDKAIGLNINAGLTDNDSWNGGQYTTGKKDLSVYNSQRYTLGVTKEFNVSEKDSLLVGVQYQHDKMEKEKLDKKDFRTILQAGAGKADTYGVFIQDEHNFNDKLSLIGAIRYDHWTVKDGFAYDKKGLDVHPDSRSDSALSPKIALNYKFDDTQSSYVSWGKAFSAPSLYDMFAGSVSKSSASNHYVIPNPSLKPQIITTTEVGYKKNINDKTIIQTAVYHNKIKNINYQSATGKQSIIDGDICEERQLDSSGEGRTIGWEIGINHKFDDKFSAFANAVIQNPIMTKAAKASEEDKVVRMTPKRILNIGIDYSDKKLNAELVGNYYSKKYGKADNSDTITGVPGAYDPVFIMNFTTRYSFDEKHSLRFDLNNLLDREYYNYGLGQGRNFLLTYSYNF